MGVQTTPRHWPGVSSIAPATSPYTQLRAAREKTTLPTSAATIDFSSGHYPKVHTSFVDMRTRQRMHFRDGYNVPGQVDKPEVRPGLTSQEVGWHALGRNGRAPHFPLCKSHMSQFASDA